MIRGGGVDAHREDNLEDLKAHLKKWAPDAKFARADCYDYEGGYLFSYLDVPQSDAKPKPDFPEKETQVIYLQPIPVPSKVLVQSLELVGTVERLFYGDTGEVYQVRLDEPHTPKSGIPWQVAVFSREDLRGLQERAQPKENPLEPIQAELLAADGWSKRNYMYGVVFEKVFSNPGSETGLVQVDINKFRKSKGESPVVGIAIVNDEFENESNVCVPLPHIKTMSQLNRLCKMLTGG